MDLGYVYENAIAQMLKSAGNELFYYTFQEEIVKDEDGNKTVRNYEVDYSAIPVQFIAQFAVHFLVYFIVYY